MLDATALAGTNFHNLVYGGKATLFFNTGISMPFTVFTLCSILASAFVGVLDTHQKGEAMAESANFNGSSESTGGLGGGVIKNYVRLLPTAKFPMETLITESFVEMPAMLTSGTKVSCPRGMLDPPVRTMSGRLHNCKLPAVAEQCASQIALHIKHF